MASAHGKCQHIDGTTVKHCSKLRSLGSFCRGTRRGKTWERVGLSAATEEGEEWPSGSVLTWSSDIRILMIIRTSTQTLPSHCGRHISHFPQGPADSSRLLSLVQVGRFISTESFLWGQDFSWNTFQISPLLSSSLYFSGRLVAHGERNSEKVGVDFRLCPLLAVGTPAHHWLWQAAVSSTKSGCDIVHFWGSLWRKKMRKWEISAQCPEYKSLPQKSGPKIPQTMSSVDYGGMWDSTTIPIDLGLYSLIQCFTISPIVLSLDLSFKVGATIFFFLVNLEFCPLNFLPQKQKTKTFYLNETCIMSHSSLIPYFLCGLKK